MTPPISKDWWLAAALSTAAVPAALTQTPAGAAGGGSGVVTAVAPGGKVTSNNDVMVVGSSIVPGQRLRTDATGVLHVLFMDQSALTLGPDSELSIDEFTFDPATRQGKIRLGLNKGVLRVVGGQISKNSATAIKTPHGTVEILGGITIVETNGQNTSGTFLFGQQMSMTDNNGNTQTITRAGFGAGLTMSGFTEPRRIPANELSQQLSRLESQPNPGNPGTLQPGGAPPGQLLSTANNPGSANNPGGLSNDRLKNLIDISGGSNPSKTLRDLLGSGQMPNVS